MSDRLVYELKLAQLRRLCYLLSDNIDFCEQMTRNVKYLCLDEGRGFRTTYTCCCLHAILLRTVAVSVQLHHPRKALAFVAANFMAGRSR
jgi:hypothetical protein